MRAPIGALCTCCAYLSLGYCGALSQMGSVDRRRYCDALPRIETLSIASACALVESTDEAALVV